ncbi:MAG: RNA pseudouridine synthase [Candidatus Omnitrophica bacterium CG11_big_fil_rev_8_21_14_0_20_45_26]|uniref:RNA pseudouridine synthase n=1 Tax=Candidatus Abzuiibacterium crystallinum TaxID=1974748 RepID=A0A2H0LSC2_9BACT|nr:MAG: RNA pseudouridine synthase [Candidatus Omnitrophica bacterium CG11_big_fil_rev_8_21_14_0_20_45_26]PIW63998.1 MAG: RNA pseudouridine synthase [Candidatus Omnitrophica bacterium CG12_big_fil_rev_8_21_14_0_65_45_16]
MPEMTPRIIFEDTHLIVLSKPAGLLSQGEESSSDNLVDWLRQYLGRNYVGLVHRLDRNTSGMMVVAKRTKAANRLTESLRSGELKRSYLAWLEGSLKGSFEWHHWLQKDRQKNVVGIAEPNALNAKEAELKGQSVAAGEWRAHPVSLVEFKLETGRSHQIRVQSAAMGYPVLGDQKYGAKLPFPRPALHSYRLSFPHPMSKECLTFTDDLPQDMSQIKRK